MEGNKAFFITLYKNTFPTVARYVARMGGNLEEAQDLFQDTLLIYYERVGTKTIENENAYILGIAKNLWSHRFKESSKNQPLNDLDIEATSEEKPAARKILHYLETAGKKCMDMLKAYYYDSMPINQVTKQFGYTSTHSATVAKYKCLEKVRDTIKQKSLNYADFIE